MLKWVDAQDFNITSQVVSAPGSSDALTKRRTVLASRTIPNGARASLLVFAAKVIDLANADQIFFAVERNGVAIMPGYESIPGVQFDYQAQQSVGIEVASGEIQLVAYNITGAALVSGALAGAVSVNCQAWLQGRLLALREG